MPLMRIFDMRARTVLASQTASILRFPRASTVRGVLRVAHTVLPSVEEQIPLLVKQKCAVGVGPAIEAGLLLQQSTSGRQRDTAKSSVRTTLSSRQVKTERNCQE